MAPAGGIIAGGVRLAVSGEAADGEGVGLAQLRGGVDIAGAGGVCHLAPTAIGVLHIDPVLLCAVDGVPGQLDAGGRALQLGVRGHRLEGVLPAAAVVGAGVRLAVSGEAADGEGVGLAQLRGGVDIAGAGGVCHLAPTAIGVLHIDPVLLCAVDGVPGQPDAVDFAGQLGVGGNGGVGAAPAGAVVGADEGGSVRIHGAEGEGVGLAQLRSGVDIAGIGGVGHLGPAALGVLDVDAVLARAGFCIPGQLQTVCGVLEAGDLRRRHIGLLPAGGVVGADHFGAVRVHGADGEGVGLAGFGVGVDIGGVSGIGQLGPAALGVLDVDAVLARAGHGAPGDLDAGGGILEAGDGRRAHEGMLPAAAVVAAGEATLGIQATDGEGVGLAGDGLGPDEAGAGGIRQGLPAAGAGLDEDPVLLRAGHGLPGDLHAVNGIFDAGDGGLFHIPVLPAIAVVRAGEVALGIHTADGEGVGLAALHIGEGVAGGCGGIQRLPAAAGLDEDPVLLRAGHGLPGDLDAAVHALQLGDGGLGNEQLGPAGGVVTGDEGSCLGIHAADGEGVGLAGSCRGVDIAGVGGVGHLGPAALLVLHIEAVLAHAIHLAPGDLDALGGVFQLGDGGRADHGELGGGGDHDVAIGIGDHAAVLIAVLLQSRFNGELGGLDAHVGPLGLVIGAVLPLVAQALAGGSDGEDRILALGGGDIGRLAGDGHLLLHGQLGCGGSHGIAVGVGDHAAVLIAILCQSRHNGQGVAGFLQVDPFAVCGHTVLPLVGQALAGGGNGEHSLLTLVDGDIGRLFRNGHGSLTGDLHGEFHILAHVVQDHGDLAVLGDLPCGEVPVGKVAVPVNILLGLHGVAVPFGEAEEIIGSVGVEHIRVGDILHSAVGVGDADHHTLEAHAPVVLEIQQFSVGADPVISAQDQGVGLGNDLQLRHGALNEFDGIAFGIGAQQTDGGLVGAAQALDHRVIMHRLVAQDLIVHTDDLGGSVGIGHTDLQVLQQVLGAVAVEPGQLAGALDPGLHIGVVDLDLLHGIVDEVDLVGGGSIADGQDHGGGIAMLLPIEEHRLAADVIAVLIEGMVGNGAVGPGDLHFQTGQVILDEAPDEGVAGGGIGDLQAGDHDRLLDPEIDRLFNIGISVEHDPVGLTGFQIALDRVGSEDLSVGNDVVSNIDAQPVVALALDAEGVPAGGLGSELHGDIFPDIQEHRLIEGQLQTVEHIVNIVGGGDDGLQIGDSLAAVAQGTGADDDGLILLQIQPQAGVQRIVVVVGRQSVPLGIVDLQERIECGHGGEEVAAAFGGGEGVEPVVTAVQHDVFGILVQGQRGGLGSDHGDFADHLDAIPLVAVQGRVDRDLTGLLRVEGSVMRSAGKRRQHGGIGGSPVVDRCPGSDGLHHQVQIQILTDRKGDFRLVQVDLLCGGLLLEQEGHGSGIIAVIPEGVGIFHILGQAAGEHIGHTVPGHSAVDGAVANGKIIILICEGQDIVARHAEVQDHDAVGLQGQGQGLIGDQGRPDGLRHGDLNGPGVAAGGDGNSGGAGLQALQGEVADALFVQDRHGLVLNGDGEVLQRVAWIELQFEIRISAGLQRALIVDHDILGIRRQLDAEGAGVVLGILINIGRDKVGDLCLQIDAQPGAVVDSHGAEGGLVVGHVPKVEIGIQGIQTEHIVAGFLRDKAIHIGPAAGNIGIHLLVQTQGLHAGDLQLDGAFLAPQIVDADGVGLAAFQVVGHAVVPAGTHGSGAVDLHFHAQAAPEHIVTGLGGGEGGGEIAVCRQQHLHDLTLLQAGLGLHGDLTGIGHSGIADRQGRRTLEFQISHDIEGVEYIQHDAFALDGGVIAQGGELPGRSVAHGDGDIGAHIAGEGLGQDDGGGLLGLADFHGDPVAGLVPAGHAEHHGPALLQLVVAVILAVLFQLAVVVAIAADKELIIAGPVRTEGVDAVLRSGKAEVGRLAVGDRRGHRLIFRQDLGIHHGDHHGVGQAVGGGDGDRGLAHCLAYEPDVAVLIDLVDGQQSLVHGPGQLAVGVVGIDIRGQVEGAAHQDGGAALAAQLDGGGFGTLGKAEIGADIGVGPGSDRDQIGLTGFQLHLRIFGGIGHICPVVAEHLDADVILAGLEQVPARLLHLRGKYGAVGGCHFHIDRIAQVQSGGNFHTGNEVSLHAAVVVVGHSVFPAAFQVADKAVVVLVVCHMLIALGVQHIELHIAIQGEEIVTAFGGREAGNDGTAAVRHGNGQILAQGQGQLLHRDGTGSGQVVEHAMYGDGGGAGSDSLQACFVGGRLIDPGHHIIAHQVPVDGREGPGRTEVQGQIDSGTHDAGQGFGESELRGGLGLLDQQIHRQNIHIALSVAVEVNTEGIAALLQIITVVILAFAAQLAVAGPVTVAGIHAHMSAGGIQVYDVEAALGNFDLDECRFALGDLQADCFIQRNLLDLHHGIGDRGAHVAAGIGDGGGAGLQTAEPEAAAGLIGQRQHGGIRDLHPDIRHGISGLEINGGDHTLANGDQVALAVRIHLLRRYGGGDPQAGLLHPGFVGVQDTVFFTGLHPGAEVDAFVGIHLIDGGAVTVMVEIEIDAGAIGTEHRVVAAGLGGEAVHCVGAGMDQELGLLVQTQGLGLMNLDLQVPVAAGIVGDLQGIGGAGGEPGIAVLSAVLEGDPVAGIVGHVH